MSSRSDKIDEMCYSIVLFCYIIAFIQTSHSKCQIPKCIFKIRKQKSRAGLVCADRVYTIVSNMNMCTFIVCAIAHGCLRVVTPSQRSMYERLYVSVYMYKVYLLSY